MLRVFWSICFVLFLLFTSDETASALGNEIDYSALLKFKESVSRDPFGVLTSWNSSSHFCNWQGVTCGQRHQRVTELNLTGCLLHGFLSPHVGNLSFLRILDLGGNSFHGNVPQELGRLFRQQFISFNNNSLGGEFPISLTNCSELRELRLHGNQFNGQIPVEIDSLMKLEVLDIGTNNLTGQIPASIGNLSSLVALSVASNQLEGNIPEQIGLLKNLRVLTVSINKMSGMLPFSLYNLSSLTTLSTSINRFSGSLPSNVFSTLPNIRQFFFAGNHFSGPIPISITNASRIQRLAIGVNNFVGQIPRLGTLQSLSYLNVAENNLGSNSSSDWEFIKSLINCSQLNTVIIETNNFGGPLPKIIGNLSTQLTDLAMADNQISGKIPTELGNLVHLFSLTLGDNLLTEVIPETFGKFQNMQKLYLGTNKLSGEIPVVLGNLSQLFALGLQSNMLIDLSRNNLSGTIPKELQNISVLEWFNASFNKLEGEVPIHGVFQNARAVSLTGNGRLCGGVTQLHLPLCPPKAMKKRKHHIGKLTLLIIICSIVLLLLLSFVLTVYQIRKRQRKATTDSTIEQLPKVAYQDLYHATDGFSVQNLIGTGSLGFVYKGSLNSEERVVAIKVLNLQKKGAHKSFIAECNAFRNIRHRNLVKIITCCSSMDYKQNDFKAIVFEYMANGSLEEWLHPENRNLEQPRTLKLEKRLEVVIGVASALHYLHYECEHPIIHCDLKPSNVLLDDDMVAHVSDFGLARLLSTIDGNSHKQTSSIGIKGTIGYAPPEYGMDSQVSKEGDMYSFGILLLEMLTGRRPTGEMFKDGHNLHNYVKIDFPNNILEIVDATLLSMENEHLVVITGDENSISEIPGDLHPKVERCLFSLFKIGLSCSVEFPRERMNMKEVIMELNTVSKAFAD